MGLLLNEATMEQLDKAVELINEAKAVIDKNNTGHRNTGHRNTGNFNTRSPTKRYVGYRTIKTSRKEGYTKDRRRKEWSLDWWTDLRGKGREDEW